MASVYLNIGMSFDSSGADYVELPEEEIVPVTHEYLFNALDADLNRLEAYAQNYMACLDNGADPDKAIMQRIREELSSLIEAALRGEHLIAGVYTADALEVCHDQNSHIILHSVARATRFLHRLHYIIYITHLSTYNTRERKDFFIFRKYIH